MAVGVAWRHSAVGNVVVVVGDFDFDVEASLRGRGHERETGAQHETQHK